MKSNKMKIAPADIVKQVWHVLRALAKATPDVKADVSKVKDIVSDLLRKKKRYGGITIHSRSLLHLPESFTKVKKGCNSSDITPCTCFCTSDHDAGITLCNGCNNITTTHNNNNSEFFDGELVLYESMNGNTANNSQPDTHPVSNFLQRIDEDALVHSASSITHLEEIDQLADDFIASFHEKFRLEKQQSYRRYQDMLARST